MMFYMAKVPQLPGPLIKQLATSAEFKTLLFDLATKEPHCIDSLFKKALVYASSARKRANEEQERARAEGSKKRRSRTLGSAHMQRSVTDTRVRRHCVKEARSFYDSLLISPLGIRCKNEQPGKYTM